MEFNVNSKNLLTAIQSISGAISSNPVLPIIEGVLFELVGDTLSLTATDLEVFVTNKINVDKIKNGSIVVPSKILLDTLSKLSPQVITITVGDNNAINIKTANGKYKLVGETAADFPSMPEIDKSDEILLPYITSEAISRVLFATSNDDLRPAMTGVLFEFNSNSLTLVATDAHKLAKFSLNINSSTEKSVIIPKKALMLLKNNVSHQDILASFSNSNAIFSFDTMSVICRLIDQRYPDYKMVIPKDNDKELVVSKSELSNSIKRALIYSSKNTNQIQLTPSSDALTISSYDIDFSNEASEKIPCSFSGETMTIGFNGKFMIDALSSINDAEIKLSMSSPSRAAILSPISDIEDTDYIVLLMPVMLSN